VLDLDDDLHGKTCSPFTLRRVDWLLGALMNHFDALTACALFGGDEQKTQAALLHEIHRQALTAQQFQTARPSTC
jgi:hypothetical protein